MKVVKHIVGISSLIILLFLAGCEQAFIERDFDTEFQEEQVFEHFSRMMSLGYNVYKYVPDGFNAIDGAYRAGATDDGEHSIDDSNIRLFNEGNWSPFINPDDQWTNLYSGIRAANLFLENSEDTEKFLINDTYTATDKVNYARNTLDIKLLRAEVRFLRAYFHFELLKRYGGIPIITKLIDPSEGISQPRASIDETFDFITSECDSVKDVVLATFRNFNNNREGRVIKGTVLALKSRALLYQASPLYNPENNNDDWRKAAAAAQELIDLKGFTLDPSYSELFLPPNVFRGPEIIWSKRYGETNFVEKANYPSTTDGGQSGTCPTHNLVDSYEKLEGWSAENPYENRDPRLGATVVTNNSFWNGRIMEIYNGGRDGISDKLGNTTKTGYYLKKYQVDNLVLSQNQTALHSWIIFRYGEILLNYAEAMNEAYGPSETPDGFSLSALDALNQVRDRVDLNEIESVSKDELRDIIRHERRVELAFEGHRFWDVRRWKIAEDVLSQPVTAMSIEKVDEESFVHNVVKIEDRTFDSKMYFYPIPQNELIKYNGSISQNEGW